jgi:hypothetical protein
LTSGYVAYGTGSGLTGTSGLTYDTTYGISVSKITWPTNVFTGYSQYKNTLDDYEVGDWFPVFAAYYGSTASASYSNNRGYYQKVGMWVHFHLNMSWTGYSGSGFDAPYITIPITSGSPGEYPALISYAYGFPTTNVSFLWASTNPGNSAAPGAGTPGIRIGYASSYGATYSSNFVYGNSIWPTQGALNISGSYIVFGQN